MSDSGYTFTEFTIKRLRAMLDWYEGGGGSDGPKARVNAGTDDAGFCKITANSGSIGSDYTVRIQYSGGTGTGGLQDFNTKDWAAENLWEGFSGGLAGYVASGVTGLRRIPVNAFVRCYWVTKSGTRKLAFTERNEPICS